MELVETFRAERVFYYQEEQHMEPQEACLALVVLLVDSADLHLKHGILGHIFARK